MDNINSPIFIIGNPRSGTSLLRLLLTSHSQIIIPPECGFIVWLQSEFGEWQLDDLFIRLDDFLLKLANCKKFETWGVSIDELRKSILISQPLDYAQLCFCIYKHYSLEKNKRFNLWGDKNNFYLHHLEELNNLYPLARFIHIVRDGRDVLCSYREVMESESDSPYSPKLCTSVNGVAKEWNSNILKIKRFIDNYPSDRAITIRYEDLVNTPETNLKKICNWLNVRFEKSIFNFYIENKKNQLEPSKTLDWKMKTLDPISNTNVGRYKCILDEESINEFISVAHEGLAAFKYVT